MEWFYDLDLQFRDEELAVMIDVNMACKVL